MDGVFTDFAKSAEKAYEHFHMVRGLYGDSVSCLKLKRLRQDMVDDIIKTPNFWKNLSWEENGPELWDFISSNTHIWSLAVLTAPLGGDMPRCKNEKLEWCYNNFDGLINESNFICADDKWNYVNHYVGDKQILIDDRETNINKWQYEGGIGILHNGNHVETIQILKEYIFN